MQRTAAAPHLPEEHPRVASPQAAVSPAVVTTWWVITRLNRGKAADHMLADDVLLSILGKSGHVCHLKGVVYNVGKRCGMNKTSSPSTAAVHSMKGFQRGAPSCAKDAPGA